MHPHLAPKSAGTPIGFEDGGERATKTSEAFEEGSVRLGATVNLLDGWF